MTDLQSRNGVFVHGTRAEVAAVGDALTITLGVDGPSLVMCPEALTRNTTPRMIPGTAKPAKTTTAASVPLRMA